MVHFRLCLKIRGIVGIVVGGGGSGSGKRISSQYLLNGVYRRDGKDGLFLGDDDNNDNDNVDAQVDTNDINNGGNSNVDHTAIQNDQCNEIDDNNTKITNKSNNDTRTSKSSSTTTTTLHKMKIKMLLPPNKILQIRKREPYKIKNRKNKNNHSNDNTSAANTTNTTTTTSTTLKNKKKDNLVCPNAMCLLCNIVPCAWKTLIGDLTHDLTGR